MPLTSLLLNILWIVFGGAWMALGWLIASLIMAITIVGLPWARAAIMMAAYTLLPFGQTVVRRWRPPNRHESERLLRTLDALRQRDRQATGQLHREAAQLAAAPVKVFTDGCLGSNPKVVRIDIL